MSELNSNEICESCKPSEKSIEWNENFQNNSKCLKEYDLVDNCMKLTKGSISECKEEWKIFRICFNKSKQNNS